MKFTKTAATGNDFILFDNREKQLTGQEADFFRRICRRKYSVGADGVILLERNCNADIGYRHFNSDGRPADMCGNGARCLARYASENRITGSRLSFEIGGEFYKAECQKDTVTIHLPYPETVNPGNKIFPSSSYEEGGFIQPGVPHFVIFTENLESVDAEKEGRKYRFHPEFKKGTNVDFVQITGTHSLKLRTYERGVEAETQACGTGAVASAVLSHINKGLSPPVEITARGGLLTIDWDKNKKIAMLTGNAELIYDGELI